MQARNTSLSPQRRRNRQALLDAAQALMAEGRTPSVTDAADRADISRATAYRYFSSPEQLQNEAALDLIARRLEGFSAEAATGGGVEDAAASLVRQVHEMSMENEAAFRTMLRLSLEAAPQRRGARRLGWIGVLLADTRLEPETRRRLTQALSILCGIEAQVVLKDVCGASDREARKTLQWAARALVRQALAEGDLPQK